MRTYGAPLCSYRIWQLTRLGTKMGSDILKFETIFGYLRESGSQIAAGDTMQIDHEDCLRFRTAAAGEGFLTGAGDLLVADTLRANEL
jgi:hypothetical protein